VNQDIWQLSATDLVDRVQRRDVSVLDITKSFLDRVALTNPTVNAICTLTAEEALSVAAAADQRLQSGAGVRPLEGVPFTVKDVIPVRGVRSTYGAQMYRDLIPDEDAVAVERLRDAGAILFGKSNTPEFAHDPFVNTTNELFGTTRNPWNVNYTAGASSGGSAASIAAGMAPLGLGTDWGGSIRGPAAFCATVGMRPSPGRVPVYPHETRSGFAWDFPIEHAHAPMARTVGDVGLMLQVIAGPDDRAPASLPREQRDYAAAARASAGPAGFRVAFSRDFGGLVPVAHEVAEAAKRAARTLEQLGCTVEEASPDFSSLKEIISGGRGLGLVLRYADYLRADPDNLSPRLADQVRAALSGDLSTLAKAEKLRTSLWHLVRKFFDKYDCLVSPTWGVLPFPIDRPFTSEIDGKRVDNFFDCVHFTYAMSVLGLPAISVPSGVSSNGLPMGVQFAGRRLREDQVLQVAAAFEAARGNIGWPPPLSGQTVKPADPSFSTSRGWTPVVSAGSAKG